MLVNGLPVVVRAILDRFEVGPDDRWTCDCYWQAGPSYDYTLLGLVDECIKHIGDCDAARRD
jgi:hypothetical protein